MSTIKKYIVLGVLLGLFLVLSVSINQVKAETITVPNEYPTIQDAVNHAKRKIQ
jgi:hypothetical protein